MELLPIPPLSKQALATQSVPPKVRRVIRLIVTCLDEVCRSVAEDCDASRHDDSTSEGQLRWRRCRNYVKDLLDDKEVVGLEDAIADGTDNALKVRVGDTAVSFYSALDGIDQPDLTGGRKIKRGIVSEMQKQIDGLSGPEPPRQLVVMYEADADGLSAAVVGMLRTPTEWAWRYGVYENKGLGVASIEPPAESGVPTYDSEPEPNLGSFDVLDEDTEDGEQTGPAASD